jgi:hypothetical protein
MLSFIFKLLDAAETSLCYPSGAPEPSGCHNKENKSNHAMNQTSTFKVIALLTEPSWFQNLE